MVLIENGEKAGVSFWYPFAVRRLPVKAVPWKTYKKWLPFRAALNLFLLGFGLLLLNDRLYDDGLFEVFAAVVLVSTLARLWFFFPRMSITITPATSTTILPLAAIDFSGTFFVLALMLRVYLLHDNGHEAAIGIQPGVFVLIFLLFGLLTLSTSIALLLGVGRLRPPSPKAS